jgi:hypothetical protein
MSIQAIQKLSSMSPKLLELPEDRFLADVLCYRNAAHDCVESAQAQGIVVGNCQPVMRRLLTLQNDMAAHLVNAAVAIMSAKKIGQICAGKISRQLHERAKTSSRTR